MQARMTTISIVYYKTILIADSSGSSLSLGLFCWSVSGNEDYVIIVGFILLSKGILSCVLGEGLYSSFMSCSKHVIHANG